MNINKDNYEEYFLLFADNELSDEEKNIVEAFVKQHADLEEEFLSIRQSVLDPGNDRMLEDKTVLFRHTKKFINSINYQQAFILYNDNELTSTERSETEAFLLENPSLKIEFELLRQTKVQPDNSVTFPDKNLLFKSSTGGKVVLFKWWKAIAAAILLAMGTWIGIDFQKKVKPPLPVTAKSFILKKAAKIISNPFDTTTSQQAIVIALKKPAKHLLKQPSSSKKNISNLLVRAPGVNYNQLLSVVSQTNNLPEAVKNGSTIKQVPENNVDAFIKNDDVASNEMKHEPTLTAVKNTVPDVITTSYVSDDDKNNNNYAFYNITEEKFNRSKVGGFLRKMKRIIERKISPLNNAKNESEIGVN